MSLTEAIRSADLPAILERHYPESGARAGKRGRIRCVWRGGEDLSGSLFIGKRGKWQLHDFVTATTYDAFTVLTDLVGLSKSQAADQLTNRRANPKLKRAATAPELALVALPDLPEELLGWLWAHHMVDEPLWGEPMSELGRHCLGLLGDWLAECIALEQLGARDAPVVLGDGV